MMPTVRIPIPLAIPAMTGAAPVPVPPPIPAVTKTILVPSSSSFLISSWVFWASLLPTSGFAPAPKPLFPSMIFTGTGDLDSDWLSVLQTAKLTFTIPSAYIFLTALHPPPPTPITLMMFLVVSSVCPKSIGVQSSFIISIFQFGHKDTYKESDSR